jgi:hypothetical protein
VAVILSVLWEWLVAVCCAASWNTGHLLVLCHVYTLLGSLATPLPSALHVKLSEMVQIVYFCCTLCRHFQVSNHELKSYSPDNTVPEGILSLWKCSKWWEQMSLWECLCCSVSCLKSVFYSPCRTQVCCTLLNLLALGWQFLCIFCSWEPWLWLLLVSHGWLMSGHIPRALHVMSSVSKECFFPFM